MPSKSKAEKIAMLRERLKNAAIALDRYEDGKSTYADGIKVIVEDIDINFTINTVDV